MWAEQGRRPVIDAAASGQRCSRWRAGGGECGAPGSREAPLFALLERGAPLLLTVADAAVAIGRVQLLPDLVSRARALLAFALWAPDDALLMALAVKLFADRQLAVPESVVAHMIAQPGTLARRRSAISSPGPMPPPWPQNGR